MSKLPIKPPFDLAAHLAIPATATQLEMARKQRRWREQFRAPPEAELSDKDV